MFIYFYTRKPSGSVAEKPFGDRMIPAGNHRTNVAALQPASKLLPHLVRKALQATVRNMGDIKLTHYCQCKIVNRQLFFDRLLPLLDGV